MMKFGVWLATGVAVGALQPAMAQEATVDAAITDQADESAGAPANEIVVTARRRDERLMDVPVVVSALSAETIAQYNSNSLTAIGELTPTVIVGAYRANGGGTIAIRGISSPANQTGFEQAVSVAIDGVQTSNGRIAQLGFFDIAQVEVLKGPQALFFGKNSPAGVISIRTAGPGNSFEAGVRGSYEFVADEATIDSFISGPISDSLGARLAIRYRNQDGFLRNTAGPITSPFYNAATGAPAAAALLPGTSDPRPGEEEIIGRVTLAFEPSANFKGTLRVFGARSTDSGAGVATQNIGPCTGPNPRVSGVADPYAECIIDNRTTVGDLPAVVSETFRGTDSSGPQEGELEAIVSSLSLEWNFGSFTLASLTGYNKIGYDTFSGLDQTTYSQLTQAENLDAEEFSQELRFSSQFDGPLNFVLGAYYQKANLRSFSDTMLSLANYNAAAGRYTSFETFAKQDGKTYSAFGQLLWDITPQLELAGGARFTRETKSFEKFNAYGVSIFNNATTVYPGSDTPGQLEGEFEDENISPEVTLNWRPDSNHTLFAAYRTGFKSGGFGLTNPLSTGTRIGDVDFESENARGFELGGRLIALNGRLNMSAALFAYEFLDLQVNTYDPARISYTINNAGAVKQRGFEVEGNFRVTPEFSIHGAIAYVRNRFSDFTGQCYSYTFPTGTVRATAVPPPNCSFVNSTALTLQQVYDGRAPARSPDWAGNAGFKYALPISSDHEVRISGDTYYSGSYFAADTLAAPTEQEAFWRFNASATFAQVDDRWSLGLIGRNLTNKYYLLYAADRTGGAGVPGAIGEQRGVVSRGREISVQASYRF